MVRPVMGGSLGGRDGFLSNKPPSIDGLQQVGATATSPSMPKIATQPPGVSGPTSGHRPPSAGSAGGGGLYMPPEAKGIGVSGGFLKPDKSGSVNASASQTPPVGMPAKPPVDQPYTPDGKILGHRPPSAMDAPDDKIIAHRPPPKPPESAGDEYLNRSTDTVRGQLDSLLASDSDNMRRAHTKGLQVANSRGLANSSLAAGAAQAAAIDAALPIAQQDAGTYAGFAERNQQLAHQMGMNADQFAQERAIKQWEQENLAYSQFLKGVADINMQDMNKEAKDQAVQNLWDMYLQGRPISSSLSDVQIKNGKIVRSGGKPATGGVAGTGGATGGGAGGNAGGGTGGGTPGTGMSDYWDYESTDKMPTWMQEQYKARYGNIQPKTFQQIQDTVNWLNGKYEKYIVDKGGSESPMTGVRLKNGAAYRQYMNDLSSELKKIGVNVNAPNSKPTKDGYDYSEIYRAMTGRNYVAPTQWGQTY